MSINWYAYLRSSKLYYWFLKHRVWVAQLMIRSLLYQQLMPMTLVFVWIMLPVAIGAHVLHAALPMSGEDGVLLVGYSIIAYFIIAGPITWKLMWDTIHVSFAMWSYMFGNRDLLEVFFIVTRHDLQAWQKQNA
ncbi:MAG: hypothetical protein AAF641_11920 [Pseudomonadota bacterium]